MATTDELTTWLAASGFTCHPRVAGYPAEYRNGRDSGIPSSLVTIRDNDRQADVYRYNDLGSLAWSAKFGPACPLDVITKAILFSLYTCHHCGAERHMTQLEPFNPAGNLACRDTAGCQARAEDPPADAEIAAALTVLARDFLASQRDGRNRKTCYPVTEGVQVTATSAS